MLSLTIAASDRSRNTLARRRATIIVNIEPHAMARTLTRQRRDQIEHSRQQLAAGGEAFDTGLPHCRTLWNIGTTLATRIGPGNGRLRVAPFVSAAVEFAGNTDWQTSARFMGESSATDPFAIQMRSPGTFGRFDIGADVTGGSNLALKVSYDPEFGSHYTTHQGLARPTCRF